MKYVDTLGDASRPTSDRSLVLNSAAILLDWDGCVMIDDMIVPAARTLMRQYAEKIVILSNNSTHLPEDFWRILSRSEVYISASRIVLAGAEALRWLTRQPPARIMLFGSTRIRCHARLLGLNVVREHPEIVVLMRDTRFTYAKLDRAINALHRGARLVVANGDLTHPGAGARIVPETGALLAAVKACVPDVEAMTIGKPGPFLFERACAVAGVLPQHAVMIGDNPDTDVVGALNYGIHSILIGPRSTISLEDLIGSEAEPPTSQAFAARSV